MKCMNINCNKELTGNQIEKGKKFCNEYCEKAFNINKNLSYIEIKKNEENAKIYIQDKREILFGKRYKDCTFENYICKNNNYNKVVKDIKRITEIIKSGKDKIFAFVGLWGTGKDHLAAAMVNCLNINILHTTIQKISRELRDCMKKESYIKQDDVMNKYINCKLLIINEIGVQSITLFERNILYEIVDSHYRNMTSCLLISNEGYDNFRKCIDGDEMARTFDRIDEIIIFNFDSYRKKQIIMQQKNRDY